MTEHRLTESLLRKLKPDNKEMVLADGGGLNVRLRDNSITFFYRYHRPDDARQATKISIGIYPETSLAAARVARDELRRQVADGIDPQLARQDRSNQLRLQLAERLSRARVRDVHADWTRLYVQAHRNSVNRIETQRLWSKDILPVVGDIALVDVRKRHVNEVLDQIVDRGATSMAGRTLAELRQFFDWGLSRGLVTSNPTDGLRKKSLTGGHKARDRNLSFEEVRMLLRERLPASALGNSSAQAVRLLLSTGCRVGELLNARWEDIDLSQRTWRLPTTKSKRTHIIHLSRYALEAFHAIGILKESPFVFPARGFANRAANGKRITKQVSDRQCAVPLKNRTASKGNALVLSGGYWSPHDLRRTLASRLADLKVDFIVIELMLNHELQGVAKVYQRSERLAERRSAYDQWGETLSEIEQNGRLPEETS